MPRGGGLVGDLYVRFVVEFPNSKACALWGEEGRRTLEELLPEKPHFPQEENVRHRKMLKK